jgi:DNA-binding GntR family transcriptional regulator
MATTGSVLSGEAAKQLALLAIRDAIARGDMAPAQRLVEQDLAEQYGVTRGSIRAALIDLAADGLIERVPNRGSRVRVVSVEEAVEITECRMVLEGLCAQKAAENASDESLDALAVLAEQMQDAVRTADPVTYSGLNRRLHASVRELSGQTVAMDLLERLNAQLVRHRFQLALRPGRPQQSLGEHLDIIDALRARSGDQAEAAVRAHLRSVIEALRA